MDVSRRTQKRRKTVTGDSIRKALLAQIHIAKAQLGLDDALYRGTLQYVTGKRSCADMDLNELQAVIAQLKARGFQASHSKNTGPWAGKIKALWMSGYWLGLIHSLSDEAMRAFIKRQTGIDHPRFLISAHDAGRVIEGLRAWLFRDGFVNWSLHTNPRRAVVDAQWLKLQGSFKMFADKTLFDVTSERIGALHFKDYKDADWDRLIQTLGQDIRDEMKKRGEL